MTLDLTIRNANDRDIGIIYDWITDQNRREVHGTFQCNWNLTIEKYYEGKLLVAVDNESGDPVAYQWGGLIRPGILEVKEDMRGKGIGSRMVSYCIEKAQKEDICIFQIQCKPSTSIPFWEKMGFKIFDSENHAYKIVNRNLRQPKTGKLVAVNIFIFKEERKWKPETEPSIIISRLGTKTKHRIVHLERRATIINEYRIWDNDAVIGVEVDGDLIYLDKAKYQDAEELGLRDCQSSNGWYFDKIKLG